jgi:uracil-DNA glycosylase family 4
MRSYHNCTPKADWEHCCRCELSQSRRSVVLRRGGLSNPLTDCNITNNINTITGLPLLLLIGERPGTTEDTIGYPFAGESGRILNLYFKYTKTPFYFILTNTVCCITDKPPSPQEIAACSPHITELLDSYHFNGIIQLGEIASTVKTKLPTLQVFHPAYIARLNYKHLELLKIGRQISSWLKHH